MSISGTDASFHHPGGIQPREEFLTPDFLGGVLMGKALLGLAAPGESIDAAIAAGHPYGRDPTTPGRPTLEFPTWTLRAAGERPQPDTRWQEHYAVLASQLPPEMQQLLIQEMRKPAGERSPAAAALNNVLITLALFLSWAEEIALPTQGPASERNSINKGVIALLLSSLFDQSSAIAKEGFALLQQLSANDPEHDKILSSLQALSQPLSELEALAKGAKGNSKLAEAIATLTDNYYNSSAWGQLQLVGPLLKAMSFASTAALQPEALRPLALALEIAHLAFDSSGGGAWGKNLESLIGQLGEGLVPQMAQPLIALIAVIAYNGFATEAGAQAAVMLTDLLTATPWLSALTGKEGGQSQQCMELAALALLIKMVQSRDGAAAERLVEQLTPLLMERLITAEELLKGDEKNNSLISALTQGKLALKNGDIPAFLTALGTIAEAAGADPKELDKEIAAFAQLAANMALVLNPETLNEQTTITGVMQA